jgi:hypothetical protein
LDDNCTDDDNQKEGIVEEILENIGFRVFQFPRINFIKYLQQHKHIEENRVMLTRLFSPLGDTNR